MARDLRDLFRLLGCDCEISVDWDRAHFARHHDGHRRDHDAYRAWLTEEARARTDR